MIDSASASFAVIFPDDSLRIDWRALSRLTSRVLSERLDNEVAPALLGIDRCLAHIEDGLIDVEDDGPNGFIRS